MHVGHIRATEPEVAHCSPEGLGFLLTPLLA